MRLTADIATRAPAPYMIIDTGAMMPIRRGLLSEPLESLQRKVSLCCFPVNLKDPDHRGPNLKRWGFTLVVSSSNDGFMVIGEDRTPDPDGRRVAACVTCSRWKRRLFAVALSTTIERGISHRYQVSLSNHHAAVLETMPSRTFFFSQTFAAAHANSVRYMS